MAAQDHPFDYSLDSHPAHKDLQRDNPSSRPPSMIPDTIRPTHHQRPIDEAVSNAFGQAETSSYVPPELIAQITQNVIKQLQTTGLDGSTPVPPPQGPFNPPPPSQPTHVHQPIPQSPSTTASGTSPNMPNRVFTPPSPQKHSDYPDYTSPPMQFSDPPLSPSQSNRASHFSPNRSSSPISQSSESSERHASTRPRGPSRLHTGKEETTLERIWGPLFDEESRPTARLGQFLRGLAIHIIEDYEPRHSIVITPDKMIKFYQDVKLDSELYPWSVVFDDEHSSISRMYRDLAIQHHLVQERFDQRPDIPALTPVGFERWMTLMIQAHPDLEFERLQKAVLEMPISNPDDKKERFPKEVSRRLFPGHGDHSIRYRVEDSMVEHASIEIPRRASHEELRKRSNTSPPKPSNGDTKTPQDHRPSVSFAEPEAIAAPVATHKPSQIERERAPYANVPDSAILDDTNPPEPAIPTQIERERKPYSAQVGGGRAYEAEDLRPREASKPRAESIINSNPKMSRSDSASTHPRPNNIQAGNPQMPKAEIHHHPRAASNTAAFNNQSRSRRRSPSFSRGSTHDYRRSEADMGGRYVPSFEPASGPRNGGINSGEPVFDESDTKRYFEDQARERARRKANDDSRMYGESPQRRYDDPRGPKRGDYANDDDYYRAGGRRERGYDDGYREPHGGSNYR